MAGLSLITPPASEPVSLADAYDSARVTTPDDALMTSLITAAREFAETYTRRQFVTATWLYALDAFRASFVGPGYDTFRQPATLPQTLGSFPFGTMSYPWNVINIPSRRYRPSTRLSTSTQTAISRRSPRRNTSSIR